MTTKKSTKSFHVHAKVTGEFQIEIEAATLEDALAHARTLSSSSFLEDCEILDIDHTLQGIFQLL